MKTKFNNFIKLNEVAWEAEGTTTIRLWKEILEQVGQFFRVIVDVTDNTYIKTFPKNKLELGLDTTETGITLGNDSVFVAVKFEDIDNVKKTEKLNDDWIYHITLKTKCIITLIL